MSDTPKLDFEERQRTQQVYEECCENPEDFAYNFVALQGELAAAQERIAQLESTLIDVQKYGQTRIAELEGLLREVLRQGCEYHSKKYALIQMDNTLIQDIADAIDTARKEPNHAP